MKRGPDVRHTVAKPSRGLKKGSFICGLLVTMVLLAACAPAAQTSNKAAVAVINAPTESRVSGLADQFETVLNQDPASSAFSYCSNGAVRFQEAHRDMHGSGAALQAAFIARNLGCREALMIGAPTYQREVSENQGLFKKQRQVTTTVQLQALVVDPASAKVIATYTSKTYKKVRLEPMGKTLVAKADDPDLLASRQAALEELKGPVAAELAKLVSP